MKPTESVPPPRKTERSGAGKAARPRTSSRPPPESTVVREHPPEDLLALQRDLGLALSRTSDLQTALQAVLDAALRIDGFDCGGIYLWDPASRALDLTVSRGLSEDFLNVVREMGPDSPQTRKLLRGEPIHTTHEAIVGRLAQLPVSTAVQREGLHAVAAAPIFYHGELLGCLNLASRKACELGDWSLHAMESLASTVGTAVARIRAEQALRESGAIYTALVEATGTGYVILDDQGRVVDANAEYLRLTGRGSMEEILGHPVTDWTAAHDRERNARAVEQCFEQGSVKHLQIDYVGDAGGVIPVEVGARAVQTRRGRQILGLCQDISDRRRIEAEMQKAERLESIGVLAGGIAHDFNNILMGITGNISLARLRLHQPEAVLELLEEAERAAFRARDLTQQLLTFARGGAPVRRTAAVQELIRDSAAFVLRGSPVTAEYDLPVDLWPVEVDAGQISQVIQNIVLNAAQAMPGGGRVAISARNFVSPGEIATTHRSSRYVRISIADQGPGIPPENLRRIFDPYFTTKETGSGIGLAVAYSIVRRHEGKIDVESELGSGATFHVALPASERWICETPRPKDAPLARRGHVLLMDDDEASRAVATRMFRELGFDVTCTADGAEAIQNFETARASGRHFDLVVLDLTVPGGMGGMECFERLRRIDPDVRVVVSSGYSTASVMADPAGEHALAGSLTKPYRLEDLENLLRRL